MTTISAIGKYLDQPLLTAKLEKKVPTILTIASSAYVINQIKNTPPEDRKKTGLKSTIILATTMLSAIQAPKIASYITKRPLSKSLHEIKTNNAEIINDIIKQNKNNTKNVKDILEKAKENILSIPEISRLQKNLDKKSFDKLIPPPENITSKDIFREIGWLSIFGAIPVAGGITGGILADKITEKNWKDNVPNKIKEGLYQYLANIFMCNIGAGAALGILEKMNIKSKTARCIGMVSGIILTGVIGGSAIANYISNKLINPIISKKQQEENRTPELLDLGLHTDDIATVSLLSGLKWIEPSLPLLYAISGYRAGIGYRNSEITKQNSTKTDHCHFLRQKC